MRMERLLLVWDDLDDVVGIARHAALIAVTGLAGAVGGWVRAARLPAAGLSDPASEP